MNDYKFGNFICSLREERGLTQADVARALDVTPAAVSKWENGASKPRVEVLFHLAELLGARPEELMAGERLREAVIDPETVRRINERYEYLRRIESYETASVKLRRLLSWIIDWNFSGLLPILLLTFLMPTVLPSLGVREETGALIMLSVMLLFPLCMILRDVIFGGRSIGKRITGLLVLDRRNAKRALPWQCLVRNLFLMIVQVDVIILLIRGQSVGDSVAHTLVVSKREYESRGSDDALPTASVDPLCGAEKEAPRSTIGAPSDRSIATDEPMRDLSEFVREVNSYPLPSDEERRKRRKKTVFIVVSSIIGGILLLLLLIQFSLNGVKKTEEYALAYDYLITSEQFAALSLDASRVRLYGYSSVTDPSGTTLIFSFSVGGRSFEVVGHVAEGEWQVCPDCTSFR